jgi:hypothetical protein
MRCVAMKCKYLNECAFIIYGSHLTPFTAKMTRLKYCDLGHEGCARYNAYQSMDVELVPDDLWPNLEIKTLGMIERKINESYKPQQVSVAETD